MESRDSDTVQGEADKPVGPKKSQGRQRTQTAISIMKKPWRTRFNTAKATEDNWFIMNIKKKECVLFVQRRDPSDSRKQVCRCGKDWSQHLPESRIHNEGEPEDTEWDPETHIIELPTDAFGELKFTDFGKQTAKYVRASSDTPPQVLYEMMRTQWKLRKPNLVISVTGGDENLCMKPRLKNFFSKGLVKAAQSTGAWIITGGCHAGVAKLVGEAVRDFSRSGSSYANSQIATIGIAHWGTVHNRDWLIRKQDTYNWDNTSPTTTTKRMEPPEHSPKLDAPRRIPRENRRTDANRNQGGPPAEYCLYVTNQESLCCLDNNHSYFILVDDGTQGSCGVEVPLRTKLEKFISEQTKKEEGEDLNIPIVRVVLGGGPGTLDTIHSSMSTKTPFVFVAGSGDFADVIAQVAEMDPSEITVTLMKEKLSGLFQGSDVDRCTKKIQGIMRKRHLLTIFREEKYSAQEMDAAIIQALLKVPQSNKNNQLHMAVLLDHLKIAKSNILNCDWSWTPEDLYPALTLALIENRPNFVRLFLDQGVSLREYVKKERLTKLYNTIKPNTFFCRKLEKIKKTQSRNGRDANQLVTLEHVEEALKSVLGNIPRLVESTPEETQDNKDTKFQQSPKIKYPIQVLLIWAVVQNRGELAEIIWTQCPDCIVGALTCSRILRARSKKENNTDNKEEMKALADRFEAQASGVFSECCREDEKRAEQLLTRRSLYWGDTTCMELGTNAEAMCFMSNGGVQKYLNKIWWGKLSENNSFIRLLFCIVFLPLICTDYITFRDEESGTLGPLQRLHGFFKAPVVIFYYNAASYIGFLWLYAYVLMVDFRDTPSWTEFLLYIWIISFVCEEVRQLFYDYEGKGFVDKGKMYISEFWNQMDAVAIVFFVAGIVFRFITDWPYVGRVILALDFIAFCLRLMFIFTLSRTLGPKIIILRRMTKDIFFFLFLLAVWVVSFGVSKQAITVHNEHRMEWIFRNVIYQPYLQLFGQMITNVDKTQLNNTPCTPNGTDPNLPQCPQTSSDGNIKFPEWLTIILLCLYLLFANILLLNLLIAMFSNTFTVVQENTDQIWKFQRHKLIKEYSNRPPAPPPFILLNLLYVLGKKAVKVISEKLDHDQKQTVSEHELDDGLLSWEKCMQDVYLDKQREVHNQSSDMKIRDTSKKVHELAKLLESKQKPASEVEQQVHFPSSDSPLYVAEKEGRQTHNPWIQNPEGRTGITGLGSLMWSGPYQSLHLVLTRWKKNKDGSFVWKDSKKVLEVLAVKRDGWERWGLPGGILRPDEKLPAQLKEILKEESWEKFEDLLEKGTQVYKGYLDDPRNTDDARVEIRAVSVHPESPEDLKFLESKLCTLESVYSIRWQMVDQETPLFANMKDILQRVTGQLNAHY